MKLPLINSDNLLPEDYVPCLEQVQDGYEMECRAARCMRKMICAALQNGIRLRVYSAYRSIDYQKGLFLQDIQKYISQGMSPDEAFELTSRYIALPGASEHNAGLAADITSPEWEGELSEEFENTPQFKWLSNNAHRFGFILRYPRDKENITGIGYEPWHYRFVTCAHAGHIEKLGITLEEYLALHNC